MLRIPPPSRFVPLISLLYGLCILVWLSEEDSVWLVALFGIGLSLLMAVHGVFRLAGLAGRTFRARVWMPGLVALGALVGAGGVPATLLLMLMKTSLHGHLYPDYPFPLMSAMAARLPSWAAAGALIGLGLALALYGRRRD